jgi:arginine/lysine/ornithine decarboxylase
VEAIAFRQKVSAIAAESTEAGGWFFIAGSRRPSSIQTGKTIPFHTATRRCWRRRRQPGSGSRAAWHGFAELEDDWCMLDPIKVSIVAPGMSPTGDLAVGRHSRRHRDRLSVRPRDRGREDHRLHGPVLFSMGITKGKWGTLLNALLDFRRDYDENEPWS